MAARDGNCGAAAPRWGAAGTRQRPGLRGLYPGRCPRTLLRAAAGCRSTTTRPALGVLLDGIRGTTQWRPADWTARMPLWGGQRGGGAGGHGSNHAATAAQRRRSMTSRPGQGRQRAAGRARGRPRRRRCRVDEVLAAVRTRAPAASRCSSVSCATTTTGAPSTALDYSAHPTAAGRCARSAARSPAATTSSPWPRCTASATWRSATSPSSWRSAPPHRGEAFEACRDLIDTLKATVPIWKHQQFADGSDEWVGLP